MANTQHVELLRGRPLAFVEWRTAHPEEVLDLQGADLRGLVIACFLVSPADFRNCNLTNTLFLNADLMGCGFSGAKMHAACFYMSQLRSANLTQADLMLTRFQTCGFHDAQMQGARLLWTAFIECYLQGARGLNEVIHAGPCTIDLETLVQSLGHVPRSFLRGCGVPDTLIEYVRSRATSPTEYYTCFLSHSSHDDLLAKHLFNKLQGTGVRCWYFPESARTGEKLWEEIDRAIWLYDKLIIICSAHSLESKAVIKEIEEGLKREQAEALRRLQDQERVEEGELSADDFASQRYHSRILFPIAIDDYTFEGWQHPLKYELQKNRVIGDFRGWEDRNTFNKAFKKLLRDLNARE